MANTIYYSDRDFEQRFSTLLNNRMEFDATIEKTVAAIVQDVKTNGDRAVRHYTQTFDGHEELVVSKEEIKQAHHHCDKTLVKALGQAADRIRSYHEKQMPRSLDYKDKAGVRLGNIWRAIESVGLYVPGGLASYPSSVLMNAIPAQVAGVRQLAITVPAPRNELNPAILVAADMLGIEAIYKVGGAQAIAAFAYGTGTIQAVDKIAGPGNAYVAAAKKQVFGVVGIDMIAGPSEILVVSDNKTPAAWIAADLLSQAEHDKNARSILITDDAVWAKEVEVAIAAHLKTLKRSEIASTSWQQHGMIIIVEQLQRAVSLINRIAPEHLELALDDKQANGLLAHIHNAGAVFLGRYTPEAIGDYTAGPSHVLPTASTARFSSGLSVFDFLKRMSVIGCSQKSFGKLAGITQLLAEQEGLDAHALSITIRR